MRTGYFLLFLLLFSIVTGRAAGLTPAISADDLDMTQCMAFENGKTLGTAAHGSLEFLLGLTTLPEPATAWSTGPVAGRDRHFRVAFTHPVSIGTICTTYSGGHSAETLFQLGGGTMVSVLKPTAAYPGDVSDDAQWLILPPGTVKTLPPGTLVRALRFTDRRLQLPWANLEWGMESSEMGMALLLKERCYPAVALGTSKTVHMGKEKQEAWMACWPDAVPVTGLVALNVKSVPATLTSLKDGATEYPFLAPAAQWKAQLTLPASIGPMVYRLPQPVITHAVRLIAAQAGALGTVIPLVELGEQATPPSTVLPPAPFTINYNMPQDGFIAINIVDKKSGTHVRRLVAEVARLKGQVPESWDLKDDAGQYVSPGEYSWSAITRPPLKLTYEGTVNNAGQPAWYAPVRGGGGWMSDHCAPVAVRAIGDRLFLGTYGSEYGQAIIATDLDGNKLWGGGNLPAERIASDGAYAYLITPGGVQRVDSKTFSHRQIASFSYTRELPAGTDIYGSFTPDAGDAAVRNNILYMLYNAPAMPWLQSAFSDELVDLNRCMPMPPSRPRDFDARNYDERQRLFAAFLTGSSPSSELAGWGEAPKNGALAGTLTMVFTAPLPVGSILLQTGAYKVYALKPDGKVPGGNADDMEPGGDAAGGGLDEDPFDPAQWVPLESANRAGPVVALAPKGGIFTRALRFKAPTILFSQVFNRRYIDIASEGELAFTEGQLVGRGGWSVSRPAKTPITPDNPARLALIWSRTVTLRGVTLVAPTHYGVTAVDYWIGPPDGNPKESLEDDTQWQQAGIIQPRENYLNHPRTPTAATVDFGDIVTTRAVRMRVIAPDGARGFGNPIITGPHNASLGYFVAYSALGDDPALPAPLHGRVTVVKLPAPEDVTGQAEIIQQIPLPHPTGIALAKDGSLYIASDRRIVRLPADKLESEPTVVIPHEQLIAPRGMTFDAAGLLYVVDAGARVVKVFNVQTGTLVRTLGTPGPPQLGPYDPTRLDEPVGITVDQNGKVWVAEASYQPKRVTRWSADGKLEKQFYGPTTYGGGGTMDPGDRSIINYFGMKFRMDWTTRQWKLESRLYRPGLGPSMAGAYPDRPIYYQGHRYLASDESGSLFGEAGTVAVLCRETDGRATPIAAAGNLASWSAVSTYPELRKAFAKVDRSAIGFCWSDLNGDGIPQLAELQTTVQTPLKYATLIGEELSFNFRLPGYRLTPTEIRLDGLPIYQLAKLQAMPELTASAWTTADGRAFVLEDKLVTADGRTALWHYPDNYASVQLSNANPWGFANRPPGVLIGELKIMGHFLLGKEEFFVTNGNHGDWYAFTADGLLAATIFGGPVGYGQRWWSMPEWLPGKTDLSDLRLTVEDFYGSICKADDGNVYALAGKNHNSIVRVDGLADTRRLSGAVTVAVADIQKTKTWEIARAALTRAHEEPKIAVLPYADKAPAIDGSLDDWPDAAFTTIAEEKNETGKVVRSWRVGLAYDHDKIYIVGAFSDNSPLQNSADDLTRLFQHGDALEVDLGMNTNADANRTTPVPGDLRLLLTRVKGNPVAMLYRYVVPGTPTGARVVFTSPVGREEIDVASEINGAEMSFATSEYQWIVEAAIPWAQLGVDPPKLGAKLRGDVGVLESDQSGTATVRRRYWANTSQIILGDLPSEARIIPALWGEIRAIEADENMHFGGPDTGEIGEK